MRCVDDLHARQQAQLDRLTGQREGAGDGRLAGDDRGDGGQQHQRQQRPFGRREKEGIGHCGGIAENQRALAQIIQHQRGQDQHDPRDLDGPTAEMAHIGVERLRPGDRQKHAAQHQKADHAVTAEKVKPVERIEGHDDARGVADVAGAEHRDGGEPDQHDRSEKGGDAARAMALHHEEGEEDHQRDRHHIGLEEGGDELQTLHRREHGNGGRDDGVAREERGAQNAQHEDGGCGPGEGVLRQRHERQGAALALVVRPHQEQHIFEGDGQEQGPEQQGDDADHILLDDAAARMGMGEGLAQGVEGAGADVAIDDADGSQGQGPDAAMGIIFVTLFGLRVSCGRAAQALMRHLMVPDPYPSSSRTGIYSLCATGRRGSAASFSGVG